jgi:hypothetical protein
MVETYSVYANPSPELGREEATMMAIQVPIEGTAASATVREPIRVALFDLLTLGIYGRNE